MNNQTGLQTLPEGRDPRRPSGNDLNADRQVNLRESQHLNMKHEQLSQQQRHRGSVQHVDHVVLEENPLEMVSEPDNFGTAGAENRFNALSSIRDDGLSDRLFDIQSLQGTASQFGAVDPTISRQRYNKEQLDKLREKNEANNRLYNFRKIYTRQNISGVSQASLLKEKLKIVPQSFKDGDWQEPLLYAYFSLNYYDEEVFKAVLKRANYFNMFQELRIILNNPQRAFLNLTATQVHLDRQRLNHLAFDAALDKDFVDIADHFIQSSSVQLTWTMVRKMLQNRQEKLVKQCIKYNTKFESTDAQTKRLIFAGRTSVNNEDRTIRLVDFIHIMLELKWKSSTIVQVIDGYSNKSKMNSNDVRELFLLFAIKRKIKLMSYVVNNEDLGFEVRVDNFLDIIENCAYDVGVLFYREYFLHLNVQEDKIVSLLVNSFSETNGMLESKAYLLKRFIKHMKYEQAIKFLEAIEKGVTTKSRGNILILTLNVVKSSCLLIELLERVRDSFGFLDRRISEIRQEIVQIAKKYLDLVENEEEMQYLLLEKDIDYRDSLNVVYDFEVVELLENPFAQKIVKNIWESKYNVSSSILSTSTVHNLLFNFNHCRYDMEKILRFNSKKDLKDFGTHGFQFETWRASARSRYLTFAFGFLLNGIVMHVILLAQIKEGLVLRENRDEIDASLKSPFHDKHDYWINFIFNFQNRAMTITYLMYCSWMFTFQHIFEAVFAAKNKREAKFTLFENILDFWIMVMGMIYITIVYKVYKWNTFIIKRTQLGEVTIFWQNWIESTDRIEDHWFLLIINSTYWIKVLVQLRLMPLIGIAYTVFLVLLGELVAFSIFFFLFQFIFAIIGNLLFFDSPSYESFSAAMMTIFKAASGIFSKDDIIGRSEAEANNQLHYTFIITYVLICFILIMNLIVGKLASAYRKIQSKREVLMLLQTLSVREASEADEKYSAAISAPYPLNILNMLFGVYVLSVKNPKHNRVILHLYYLPTMLTCLFLFIGYNFAMIPICYVKVVGHKFALIIRNPQGYGSKTKSDRLGYTLYFLALGPFILFLDSVVDICYFIKHLYMDDLIEVAQQKLEDRGYGITNSIDQRTFKKMLHYFRMKTGSDQQQIALQRDVSMDIRSYLHVEDAIQTMVVGDQKKLYLTKPQFYEIDKKQSNRNLDTINNTVIDTSGINHTQLNLISQREEKSDNLATDGDKKGDTKPRKSKKGDKKDKTPFDLALDQVKEYTLVKDMLINNSLPIVDGRYSSHGDGGFSRQLIVDKKILLNLFIDLQRFRKLLNLKKSFYIFHLPYTGKPEDMRKWHQKVEVRVTQTFKQLNIRRLIDIIGYDPSQYFKGEMSFHKVEMIKQGRYGEQTYAYNSIPRSMSYNVESSNLMNRKQQQAPSQQLGLESNNSGFPQRGGILQTIPPLNFNQIQKNKSEVSNTILRQASTENQPHFNQINQIPMQSGYDQIDRQGSVFSMISMVHDEPADQKIHLRNQQQDLQTKQLQPSFSKESFGLVAGSQNFDRQQQQPAVLQSMDSSPLSQLARPNDIRRALGQNVTIQEHDKNSESSDCDVGDSVEAGVVDSQDGADNSAYNNGSRIQVNDTAHDFYNSQQAGKNRGRAKIQNYDVQKH